MHEVVFGTTLLASFVGGVVALLAPCCVSVMVPAYLAAGFSRRRGVLAATLVFAAGVGTVIVPIGLGASAISRLLTGYHLLVFSIGGVVMAAAGVAMLLGWRPRLPMPSARPAGRGYSSAYALGVFSGAASACCAPVLVGVAVLSGATASFAAALGVGLTYVAGMVAPLAALALVWDRRDWSSSRWLHGRQVTMRLGPLRRRMALGHALAGGLLVVMGALTVVLAFTGPSMPNTGWRVRFAADLQHAAAVVTEVLGWIPGWVFGLVLLAAAVLLVRAAFRRTRPPEADDATAADPDPVTTTSTLEESMHER
ncbi:MAG: cytochrome c biogenesis protein CcdA [Streptosporangiales bacterium]|nr:cytochrome c biogenesis protein CcdA [Streptosporangiales bacterium]